MSDSVDRVFVHALATVRRLPRTGSSRPPPSARLRLYGLYKQSMEGDVLAILPRPTLPPTSPTPIDASTSANNSTSNGNALNRYGSRDLRTREAQAEIEKWDAWHACAGMTRTEAKRKYISTLIETMKEYASGTAESRELVSELEFVWSQIKNQSIGGSSEGEEGESPTRKLERAGLKSVPSYGTARSPGPGGGGTRALSRTNTDPNRLRVLSPVSARGSDEIIEGEEIEPVPEGDDDGGGAGDINARLNDTTFDSQGYNFPASTSPSGRPRDPDWRNRIETHLRSLSTEIAALREQLASNHLLSSSSFSPDLTSRRKRLYYRTIQWLRWLISITIRHIAINSCIVAAFVLWERWRNRGKNDTERDRRVERWVRRRWNEIWTYCVLSLDLSRGDVWWGVPWEGGFSFLPLPLTGTKVV